ncbi:MAG TPA: hypothetical protein VD862_03635 [Candidatus Paceibacterota bacterium]|nr:hypothetical protein [Candidatus Paceibacterota bacterium]
MPTRQRFANTWLAVGCTTDPEPVYRDLRRRYAEDGRYYHTWAHISECIVRLDRFRHLAKHPDEVEMALYWHDAVYAFLRGRKPVEDNEEQSAWLCRDAMVAGGAPDDVTVRCMSLIMATRHTGDVLTGDKALAADLDMAIMGESSRRYLQASTQIASEYQQGMNLTHEQFREGRTKFLTRTLQRFMVGPPLFHTAELAAKYTRQAEVNIRHELDLLRF